MSECGESVDLTPGVAWTDSQLVVLRGLLAENVRLRAVVQRVEAGLAMGAEVERPDHDHTHRPHA